MSSRRSDILLILAVGLGVYLAYRVRNVLLLIYVAALFAVVLTPALGAVQRLGVGRWRPGRGTALVALILAGLGLMTLFFVFALPPIFHDVQGLAQDWPSKVGALSDRIRRLPFAEDFDPSSLQQYVGGAVGGVLGIFKGVAGGLFGFFSWLILTAYFILDGRRAFRWAMSLFPPTGRTRLEATLHRAEQRMRHWLVGQAVLMLILGVSATTLFAVLGIKYFYALGVLAGALNIVPVIGPLISLAVAGTVAAFDSWGKLIGVTIFYFVYQQVENAFLTPRVMKASVDLPPLAVIIALAMGGAIAGILGALVAVPTAALVAVLIDEYLVHHDSAVDASSVR